MRRFYFGCCLETGSFLTGYSDFFHTNVTSTGQVRPVFKLQKRMPQISFTPKNQHVYDEFKTLWLQYQLDHKCNLTAPEFLKVVLDGYLLYKEIYDLQELDRQVEGVSLRDYIADAEANLEPENELQ